MVEAAANKAPVFRSRRAILIRAVFRLGQKMESNSAIYGLAGIATWFVVYRVLANRPRWLRLVSALGGVIVVSGVIGAVEGYTARYNPSAFRRQIEAELNKALPGFVEGLRENDPSALTELEDNLFGLYRDAGYHLSDAVVERGFALVVPLRMKIQQVALRGTDQSLYDWITADAATMSSLEHEDATLCTAYANGTRLNIYDMSPSSRQLAQHEFLVLLQAYREGKTAGATPPVPNEELLVRKVLSSKTETFSLDDLTNFSKLAAQPSAVQCRLVSKYLRGIAALPPDEAARLVRYSMLQH